ncbi:sterol desaturase family protein [Rhizobium sp.]|uniref:sterol desaturase family protein n=1 Tax=Rhizobium sp. TaxID=391 RepID=UPI002EF783CE
MTFQNSSRLYAAVSSLLWPAIFCAGLTGAYFAFQSDMHLLWFNVTYFSIVTIIALFERLMPYEETWLESDGETFNNIAHTLLSKGGVQIAAAIGTSFPMAVATVAQPLLSHKANIWPEQWPMALQVVLGLVIAEFGLYLAHRLAHEYLSLWRFHALHHSVERLWVINTGRFHIIDSLFKIALGQIPLYLLGAPLPVFLWIGAVTAFIGLLTHCNIDVRTGPLDWFLSTPRLHRWHHSKLLAEGNTNYGENLVIWDQILGTYYNPPRPSSTDIGITGKVADSFLAQLAQPFSKKGAKQIIGKKPKEVRDKEELAAAKAAARHKQAEEPIRKSG